MVNSALNFQMDMATECRRAAKTLFAFLKPDDPDSGLIPPNIIQKAKGIAVLTVIKAGFIWTGRIGSGVVVAKLPDGGWSAPSAIATAGAGFGAQIGAEVTDFVMILNTADAVKAFSLGGNVTLGGNLSVAAGPVGRNAEVAGTIKNAAPVFAYSKTKGLFAGISIEGSVIVERKDANANFYHQKVKAKEILSGQVQRPAAASELYRALDLRAGTSSGTGANDNINVTSPPPYYAQSMASGSSSRSATSPLQVSPTASASAAPFHRGAPPPIPPREVFATALYDFVAQRPDDLEFKKGDKIVVTKRTESVNDWWVGRCNGRSGNFPANYVQLQ